jgi:hypothetical protein
MIDKEKRKEHIEFSKNLLKIFESKTGLKYKRRVLKMVGDNPFIEISVKNWENEIIPNNIRVLIAKKLNFEVLDWDKVIYGNIRATSITLKFKEWLNVIEVLK